MVELHVVLITALWQWDSVIHVYMYIYKYIHSVLYSFPLWFITEY